MRMRNFQLYSIIHAHILILSLQLNTDNWVTATLGYTYIHIISYIICMFY